MLSGIRRFRGLVDLFRPYRVRDALEAASSSDAFAPRADRLGEVELICVVVHLHNFESMMAQLTLRDFGAVMIEFYRAVAEALMAADGDVNKFCGPSVVGHFNVLHRVAEAEVVKSAMAAFRAASAALESATRSQQLDAQIGVGVCRSLAIAGNFGAPHRFDYTARGPSAVCAQHLAENAGALSICEEFAEHFSRPQIPPEPSIAIKPHWKIEA